MTRSELARQTGLSYQQLKFQKIEKLWSNCNESKNVILNTEPAKFLFPWVTMVMFTTAHSFKKALQNSGQKSMPHPN